MPALHHRLSALNVGGMQFDLTLEMTDLLVSVLHILNQPLASVLQRRSGLRLLLELLYMLLQLTELGAELLICHAGPGSSQLLLCGMMHS